MLKLLRNKNITKVVLWALLILIVPAFVLWGTGSLGGSKGKGPTYAGKIDGKKVSFEQFGNALATFAGPSQTVHGHGLADNIADGHSRVK